MLLGLALLLVGIAEMYTLIEHRSSIKAGFSPVYAELGCATWMAAGIIFIIRGAGKKADTDI